MNITINDNKPKQSGTVYESLMEFGEIKNLSFADRMVVTIDSMNQLTPIKDDSVTYYYCYEIVKGKFCCSVVDEDGEFVFGAMDDTIFNRGIMKNPEDIRGLYRYLAKEKEIDADANLVMDYNRPVVKII